MREGPIAYAPPSHPGGGQPYQSAPAAWVLPGKARRLARGRTCGDALLDQPVGARLAHACARDAVSRLGLGKPAEPGSLSRKIRRRSLVVLHDYVCRHVGPLHSSAMVAPKGERRAAASAGPYGVISGAKASLLPVFMT